MATCVFNRIKDMDYPQLPMHLRFSVLAVTGPERDAVGHHIHWHVHELLPKEAATNLLPRARNEVFSKGVTASVPASSHLGCT